MRFLTSPLALTPFLQGKDLGKNQVALCTTKSTTKRVAWGKFFIAGQTCVAPQSTDPVMQEEIFGPILPVLPYESLDEAVKFVNARPKPLAFYFFSKQSSHQEKVLSEISFGGIGAYHGKHSYALFSHHKSVVKKPFFADVALRYPPYGNRLEWMKKLLG